MRETGFYWIKIYDEWVIAYYSGNHSKFPWDMIGTDEPYSNDDIQEIDEKQIKRE